MLLAQIVEQRRQHDFANRDAQGMDAVGPRGLRDRTLVDAQRQIAGELHHPEVRAILAAEERRRRRRAFDDDRLKTGVAGEDGMGQRIDVDVGLNKIRKVAAPPLCAVRTHVLAGFYSRAKRSACKTSRTRPCRNGWAVHPTTFDGTSRAVLLRAVPT